MSPHCRKEKHQDQEGSDLPEGTWVWTPGMVASLKNGGSRAPRLLIFQWAAEIRVYLTRQLWGWT